MTARRYAALFYGLPPNRTATARHMDPESAGWSQESELLATVAELIDQGNRYFLSANVKKGTPLPRPISIRRPGDTKKKRGTTLGELLGKAGDRVQRRPL
jgi:hypothetical protein